MHIYPHRGEHQKYLMEAPWYPHTLLIRDIERSRFRVNRNFTMPERFFKTPLKSSQCTALCLVTQSCLTLCDPMDCSPPGSSVHGILQSRILEWVAMPSSMGSSQPRDRTHVSYISCISRCVIYH